MTPETPDLPLDEDGNTPLHRALLERDRFKVNALIKLGANPLQENKAGETPHAMAWRVGFAMNRLNIARQLWLFGDRASGGSDLPQVARDI